jgi:hypothetical protein
MCWEEEEGRKKDELSRPLPTIKNLMNQPWLKSVLYIINKKKNRPVLGKRIPSREQLSCFI